MRESTTTMTVYKVEADLIDVSTCYESTRPAILTGVVRAYATNGRLEHSWPVSSGRVWPGDRVTVTLYLDDDPTDSTEQTPPPLDLRVRR